jgi:hypothetical protein
MSSLLVYANRPEGLFLSVDILNGKHSVCTVIAGLYQLVLKRCLLCMLLVNASRVSLRLVYTCHCATVSLVVLTCQQECTTRNVYLYTVYDYFLMKHYSLASALRYT